MRSHLRYAENIVMKDFRKQLTQTAKSIAVQLIRSEQPIYLQDACWHIARSIQMDKKVLRTP